MTTLVVVEVQGVGSPAGVVGIDAGSVDVEVEVEAAAATAMCNLLCSVGLVFGRVLQCMQDPVDVPFVLLATRPQLLHGIPRGISLADLGLVLGLGECWQEPTVVDRLWVMQVGNLLSQLWISADAWDDWDSGNSHLRPAWSKSVSSHPSLAAASSAGSHLLPEIPQTDVPVAVLGPNL